MFCPNCSSENSEVNFCTRCGANLGAVAEALSGKPVSSSQIDERLVGLFKDYYRGRNSMIIGVGALTVVVLKVILFAALKVPDGSTLLNIATILLTFYGIGGLFWGLSRWSDCTSEIKAIERAREMSSHLGGREHHLAIGSKESIELAGAAVPTGDMQPAGSITDQTTRQLQDSNLDHRVGDK